MYDDFLARVLEPDTFLPTQFYGNRFLSRHLDGEKRLMLAILRDAVECLDKYRGAKSSASRELYQNAVEWVADRGTAWLFSFNNICDLLGFDPDYLRDSILKREQRLARPGRGRVSSSIADRG